MPQSTVRLSIHQEKWQEVWTTVDAARNGKRAEKISTYWIDDINSTKKNDAYK